MYDEKFDESAALAELFNYKTAKLSSSTKYICEFIMLIYLYNQCKIIQYFTDVRTPGNIIVIQRLL